MAECRHTQVRCTPPPKSNLLVQSITTPGEFDMWKNVDIPKSDVSPPSIKPSHTESYYTSSVLHVEECSCTQVRCIPPSNLVVQSPTTPGQFDMWKNADIPRSKVPPPSIKPRVLLSCNTKRADNPPETHIMVQQQASDANHLCRPI